MTTFIAFQLVRNLPYFFLTLTSSRSIKYSALDRLFIATVCTVVRHTLPVVNLKSSTALELCN